MHRYIGRYQRSKRMISHIVAYVLISGGERRVVCAKESKV